MLDLFLKPALKYAKMGWPVFPIVPHEKHPLTQNGVKDATTDAAKIIAWGHKWPDANIGVATGFKFDVLDVDGKDGARSIMWLSREHPGRSLGQGVFIRVRTPSGGDHLYLTPTEGLPNRVRFLPGLDFRAKGGYVVVPPSVDYDWIGGPQRDLQQCPIWLPKLVRHTESTDQPKYKLPTQLDEGERNDGLARLIGSLIVKHPLDDAYRLAYAYNQTFAQPPLDDKELGTIFDSIHRKELTKSGRQRKD